jgi:hypothetical protein
LQRGAHELPRRSRAEHEHARPCGRLSAADHMQRTRQWLHEVGQVVGKSIRQPMDHAMVHGHVVREPTIALGGSALEPIAEIRPGLPTEGALAAAQIRVHHDPLPGCKTLDGVSHLLDAPGELMPRGVWVPLLPAALPHSNVRCAQTAERNPYEHLLSTQLGDASVLHLDAVRSCAHGDSHRGSTPLLKV